MQSRALHAYRHHASHGASRGERLVAFYDGALRYLYAARGAIERRDVAAKGHYLGAFIAVLEELQSTLERRHAPELCDNLQALYDYFIRCGQAAGLRMDPAPLDAAAPLLQQLREAWDEAVRAAAAAAAPG